MSRPFAVIPLPADALLVADVLSAAGRAYYRDTRSTMTMAAVREDSVAGLGRCLVIDRITVPAAEPEPAPAAPSTGVPTPRDLAQAGRR